MKRDWRCAQRGEPAKTVTGFALERISFTQLSGFPTCKDTMCCLTQVTRLASLEFFLTLIPDLLSKRQTVSRGTSANGEA